MDLASLFTVCCRLLFESLQPPCSIQQDVCHMPVTSSRELENVFFSYHGNFVIVQFQPISSPVPHPPEVVARGAGPALVGEHCHQIIQSTAVAARVCEGERTHTDPARVSLPSMAPTYHQGSRMAQTAPPPPPSASVWDRGVCPPRSSLP